jgi:hypothetical protein
MNILAIDVGGTHVKVLATGRRKPVEIRSGPKMTATQMVQDVRQGTAGLGATRSSRLAIPGRCCTASR